MKKLEIGHTYLLKKCYDLYECTILNVTNKAYQINWNDKHISWELIDDIESDYLFIEDITDRLNNSFEEKKCFFNFDWDNMKFEPSLQMEITCPTCNGTKYIPNTKSTAGTGICPTCNGTGKSIKIIKLDLFKTNLNT